MKSKLIKHQEKKLEKKIGNKTFSVTLRYDDRCGNGHNTFSITGDVYNDKRIIACGCMHEEISEIFPEFKRYIKWHLTSSDGPMHYLANSIYHATCDEPNLEFARSSAVWPDAELEDFTEEKLKLRLPALMQEFHDDMIELGFEY